MAECLALLFPEAELFTLMMTPRAVPLSLGERVLHTSFLQCIPFAQTHHPYFLPLYPLASSSLDLRSFDLVISSDSGPVKGVRLGPNTMHLCYCHSPMRYLYDSFIEYRSQMNGVVRLIFSLVAGPVRRWDQRASGRVNGFIANSHYVQDRIRRVYGRESEVIPPPIDLSLARRVPVPGTHYLCAGRLVGYKHTELMIMACQRLGRTLRIAGTGPEEARLRRLAGPETLFLGELSDDELWQQYAECRALLFAADEDFGMVPVEAQACGRPVIAYGAGGSLETIRGAGDQPTGVWYATQTVESLIEGIQRFEASEQRFRPGDARAWAEQFSTPAFLERMREVILRYMPSAALAMKQA